MAPKRPEILNEIAKAVHMDTRIKDIADFMGIKPPQVEPRIVTSRQMMGKVWGKIKDYNDEAVTKFFNNPSYLFSQVWTVRPGPIGLQFLEALKKIKKGSHVIDYGAGGGLITMWLASRGCNVTAVELRGPMTDWLKFVRKRHKMTFNVRSIKTVEDIPKLKKQGYDAVIASAAFGRVTAPLTLAEGLAEFIEDGGTMYGMLRAFGPCVVPGSAEEFAKVASFFDAEDRIKSEVFVVRG